MVAGSAVLAALLLACGPEAPPAPPEGAAVSTPPPAPAPPPVTPRPAYRGMWVLAEGSQRVLEDPARIPPLVERALALGVTDLFVQVHRGGRAWYDATRADATPYRTARAAHGVDPLSVLLDRAAETGLRVHAWVNVLTLSGRREAPILDALGPAAVLVDRLGRSLLEYPGGEVPEPDRRYYRMGTPGVYLDPGAPGVRAYRVATYVELIERYPRLDGLHLDYIRHPGVLPFVPGSRFGVGLDFGYGEATRARFTAETGRVGPYHDPGNPMAGIGDANAWDDWRRAQVTALVREIRAAVLAVRPGLLLSAAVIAYEDRAYLSLAQDWRRWLEDGALDFAVPMVYTTDDRLFRYQVERAASGPHADRIWIGVGTWLFGRRPERALGQLAVVRRTGAAGDVLFSYDAIAETLPDGDLYPALVADARRLADPSPPAARREAGE